MSRAKPLRGAEGALGILTCSEKASRCDRRLFPNVPMCFVQSYIAALALAAAIVIARIN
jgi:hypothetical protein